MKRKNLVVKNKVKENKLIKDSKIIKIYSKFEKIISKNIKNKSFALAVSGGADSLCLAYFGKLYSLKFENKIHVLIVDHKIRKDSSQEALKVSKMLKRKGIQSKILVWKGKTPKRNIQNNARNMRYFLMSNYCKQKNIEYLVTAHHLDDQIENFFIRLFRGSGLTGLSSMSESFNYNNFLKIIRPFLNFKKIELQKATLKYFKNFIKDPSNNDDKYLRVRVRKIRGSMEKEGLDTTKIINTVNNLFSANKALSYYKNKALYKHVSFLSKNRCQISEKIFAQEAGEIVFKSFSDILSLISGKYYPPRSKKIINLINRIKKNIFNKSTLGGCVVEKKDGQIFISKESKERKVAFQPNK
jgi:tRNA(Ile)-lysidine synthase